MPTTTYVHFSDRLTQSLTNINRVIQDNKTTLDGIQDMAIELTRSIRAMESALVKYVKMADTFLTAAMPIMSNIPLVNRSVLNFAKDAQTWAKKILSVCELSERVLPGVESGLTSADMVKLKTSTADVQKLTKSLQGLMPAAAKR